MNPIFRRYRLAVEIPEQLPLFKLDFGLMEQVIYNLIINVTQHTPEDTLITIQADCIRDRLVLTIADNGNGFPEKEIDKVFEKFYRLKGSRQEEQAWVIYCQRICRSTSWNYKARKSPCPGFKVHIEIHTEKSYVNKLKNE